MRAFSRHALPALLSLLLVVPLPSLAAGAAQPPPLLLAEVFDARIDPSLYWVSEKYDGVRAVWDGHELRFRSGRLVPAPAWFVAALPPHPLDGELWLGRGRFDALSAAVRRQVPVDDEWRQVKYMVFELPGASGTFTERLDRLRALVDEAAVPWLRAVDQVRVPDRRALTARLAHVIEGGGEGLMLHRADAHYVTGRSDVLLKLKPWLDAEARVVAHLPGQGRHRGRLGALRVETPAGTRFRLGTGFTDAERLQPPPIGSTITYRYRESTPAGVPRFASFLRVREAF